MEDPKNGDPAPMAPVNSDAGLPTTSPSDAQSRVGHERQGSGYDSGAAAHELQGRDSAPARVQSAEEIEATERALANADAPLVKAEEPKPKRKSRAKVHRLAGAEPVSQPGETAPRLDDAEPAQQPTRKRRRRRMVAI